MLGAARFSAVLNGLILLRSEVENRRVIDTPSESKGLLILRCTDELANSLALTLLLAVSGEGCIHLSIVSQSIVQ